MPTATKLHLLNLERAGLRADENVECMYFNLRGRNLHTRSSSTTHVQYR
eukprot:COSAG02_NODE_2732_length_8141_cov_41.736011_6_plen_49_part_00